VHTHKRGCIPGFRIHHAEKRRKVACLNLRVFAYALFTVSTRHTSCDRLPVKAYAAQRPPGRLSQRWWCSFPLACMLLTSIFNTTCRSAAVFARQAKFPGTATQAQPVAGGVFAVQTRWKSVGPAASAKTVSDEMLKKLGSLSTQVTKM